jgi:hypothetical protein
MRYKGVLSKLLNKITSCYNVGINQAGPNHAESSNTKRR